LKLPGHRPGPFDKALGPEHVEGLPGNVISFYIVSLDPAHSAGLAGHVPVRLKKLHQEIPSRFQPDRKGVAKKSQPLFFICLRVRVRRPVYPVRKPRFLKQGWVVYQNLNTFQKGWGLKPRPF